MFPLAKEKKVCPLACLPRSLLPPYLPSFLRSSLPPFFILSHPSSLLLILPGLPSPLPLLFYPLSPIPPLCLPSFSPSFHSSLSFIHPSMLLILPFSLLYPLPSSLSSPFFFLSLPHSFHSSLSLVHPSILPSSRLFFILFDSPSLSSCPPYLLLFHLPFAPSL